MSISWIEHGNEFVGKSGITRFNGFSFVFFLSLGG